jgi:hypothetical protein
MNDDPEVDPRVSIRNAAYLRHCDGASSGNKAEPVPTPPREVHKNGQLAFSCGVRPCVAV